MYVRHLNDSDRVAFPDLGHVVERALGEIVISGMDDCSVRQPGSQFMVYGLWFMVYGLWFMVYGLWFMVYGLWFNVDGLWFGVWGYGLRV